RRIQLYSASRTHARTRCRKSTRNMSPETDGWKREGRPEAPFGPSRSFTPSYLRSFSTLVRVFAPLTTVQWISARSPVAIVPTFAASAEGTVHVRPATVIELDETADTVPRASLRSTAGLLGAHLPGPSSIAEPPEVPPPSFPPVKPPALLNPADRFPSSATAGDAFARPAARPATLPWS